MLVAALLLASGQFVAPPPAQAQQAPAAPTIATATATSLTTVSLTWAANANADGWSYRYKATGGIFGGWTTLTTTPTTLATATASGLSAGNVYIFELRVRVAGVWSDSSAEKKATPTGLTGIKVTPGNGVTYLDWDPIPTVTGWAYRVITGSGSWTTITGSSDATTGYTATSLANGATYLISARAKNESGNGFNQSGSGIPTAAHTLTRAASFSATPGNGQATLNWTAQAAANSWEYRQRTATGKYGSWSAISGSSSTTATHIVPSLTNNTKYFFQVRAKKTTPAYTGPHSVQASATVGDLVSNTSETRSSTTSALYSAQSFTTGSAAGGYTLSEVAIHLAANTGTTSVKIRTDDSGDPGSTVVATLTGSVAKGLQTFTAPANTRLDANTTYWVSVNEGVSANRAEFSSTTSHNETGLTGWPIGNGGKYRATEAEQWASDNNLLSIAVRGQERQKPPAPTIASATPASTTTVNLTWAADASADGWSYRYKTAGGTYGSWVVLTANPTTLAAATASGLSAGKVYIFELRVRVAGEWSDPSAEKTAPPMSPTGFTATPGNGEVYLDWAPIPTVTSWQYTSNGTTWTAITGSSATTTSHTVPSLTNGTVYTVGVRAVNSVGNGLGATVAVTPTANHTLTRPASLSARAGRGQIALSWTAQGAANGWEYRQRTASTDYPSSWSAISGSGAATAGHTVPSLTPGTEYFFQVRATKTTPAYNGPLRPRSPALRWPRKSRLRPRAWGRG